MDRQGVMGVPDSRVEEVTRALEAMDDMIWSEGVAERVARVALAADAVEGDRPGKAHPAYAAGFRAGARYEELRTGGGVEASREAARQYPAAVEAGGKLGAELRTAEARGVELTAALRRYGEHDDECPRWRNQAQECACGFDAALAAAGEGEDRTPTREEERLRTLLVHFRNRLAANGLDERMIGEMDAALSFDPRRSGSRLPEQDQT